MPVAGLRKLILSAKLWSQDFRLPPVNMENAMGILDTHYYSLWSGSFSLLGILLKASDEKQTQVTSFVRSSEYW